PDHAPAVGDPRAGRPHRHQIRLRRRAVRRLHGAHERAPGALVLDPRERGERRQDHHDRRPRLGQGPAQGAEGVDRSRRAAMRLLPVRHDHGGGGAPQDESQAERRRHRRRDHQHLPLRHLPAGARSDPHGRQGRVRETTMTAMPKFKISRRRFLISSAALGGGPAPRMMLVQAAANEWKVPASECTASASVITHKPSGRKTTYGKVAEAAARLEQPKDVPLKDPKTWKIAGKPLKRLDTAKKVNGAMIYGMDLKMPGMLNAAVKDCPVFGGKVKSFDAARVSGMRGV